MLYCKWDVWLLFSFSSVYFTSFISLVHVLYAYNGYVANKNIFFPIFPSYTVCCEPGVTVSTLRESS